MQRPLARRMAGACLCWKSFKTSTCVERNDLRLAGAVRYSCLLLAEPGEGYNILRSLQSEPGTSRAFGVGGVPFEARIHGQGDFNLGGFVANPAMLDPVLRQVHMGDESVQFPVTCLSSGLLRAPVY